MSKSAGGPAENRLSRATAARLSLYLRPMAELRPAVAAVRAELGVVTVPSESAQAVADALAAAGVRGILNFAPVVLRLPGHVSLVSVDLTVQLEQLAFLVQLGGE